MARNQRTERSQDPISPGAAVVEDGQQRGLATAEANAILEAVEHQLTRFFAVLADRADAAQRAAEAARTELVIDFQRQIGELRADLDRASDANEGYEQALQAAIEERLTEFAASQHWRIGEVEGRLARVSEEITLGLVSQMAAATVPMQQRFDRTTELLANRIEELQKAARRFDEQSCALVQHVNEATSVLGRRIDESGRTFAGQLDERTIALSQRVDDAMGGMRQHVSEQVVSFGRRVEDVENKIIDRALAMEERINEQTGVRLAGVEATIGRISNGIDEAIVELSHRVIELENTSSALTSRLDEVAHQIASVDHEAIDNLREEMSSAVGESMLVRIELERVASSTGEQFDKLNVRLAGLASDIADSNLDVSTAVQLERLEEIERALVELDPDQFVRKTEAGLAGLDPHDADLLQPRLTADANPPESSLSSW